MNERDSLGDFNIGVIFAHFDAAIITGVPVGDFFEEDDSSKAEERQKLFMDRRIVLLNHSLSRNREISGFTEAEIVEKGRVYARSFEEWKAGILYDPSSSLEDSDFAINTSLKDLADTACEEHRRLEMYLKESTHDVYLSEVLGIEVKRWKFIAIVVKKASEIRS